MKESYLEEPQKPPSVSPPAPAQPSPPPEPSQPESSGKRPGPSRPLFDSAQVSDEVKDGLLAW